MNIIVDGDGNDLSYLCILCICFFCFFKKLFSCYIIYNRESVGISEDLTLT